MTVQLVARVPEELVEAVDQLVRDGVFGSRSDAVRSGLTALLDNMRRDLVGREIVAGYERSPQSAGEPAWTDAASAAMIAEEPW